MYTSWLSGFQVRALFSRSPFIYFVFGMPKTGTIVIERCFFCTTYKSRCAISISQNICVLFFSSSLFLRGSCRTKTNVSMYICCIVTVLLNFRDDKILEHKRFYVLHNSCLLHCCRSVFNWCARSLTLSLSQSIYLYNACRVKIRCGFLLSRANTINWEIYFERFLPGQ